MAITYFKRLRMEVELAEWIPEPTLPDGYHWLGWNDSLLALHADVQFRCFWSELDTALFPCLGDRQGCLRLLRQIRNKPGFLPAATWLVGCGNEVCGMIQGVVDPASFGSIQNLGVVPEYRGLRLGRALLLKSLAGFRDQGITRVLLEVTAENSGAINLYRSVGFRKSKTLYRTSEV
ncbi:MAG: GNAT family N-acetyltransferase [Planctomycetes bacterium]|nr:GNAT family N-acetyltransferase [Planctomycetota bacterium]